MRTFIEVEKCLKERGYIPETYDYINSTLVYINYYKNNKRVTIKVNDKGDKVLSAFIELDITNKPNFLTCQKDGITLSEDDYWIKHDLSFLEYCIDLQEKGLEEHEIKILECHLRNLKSIPKEFLYSHDYYPYYSSIFDVEDGRRDSSDLVIAYKHYNEDSVYFETDCITGDLKLNGYRIKENEDFEKLFKENIWTDRDGEILLQYRYFYDPTETKESYNEILRFMDDYSREIWGNEYNLPEKYKQRYEDYKNRISWRDSYTKDRR